MRPATTAGLGISAILLTLLLFPGPASASEIKSPESIAGTTRVDAEGVIDLVNRIPDITMIDSRISSDRKQGYIEGSVSLPDIDTSCASLAKIIPQKTSPTLFYCNGIKCGRSVTAVNIALKCGYTSLYWFRGGFEEWQEKGYPTVKD